MDYSADYLRLIEEVAEDGELTHKEIFKLAKWLNDNKEGRKTWPASLFLPLLKEVFADGKIEKTEARKVGSLIQKVRREWAREHALSGGRSAKEEVCPAFANFDDGAPQLPRIDMTIRVTSFNEPDLVYEVDLADPACSCPDFRSYRNHLSVRHISRCCKHIMQAYSEVRPSTGWPSWLEPFLEAGFRPFPNQNWAVHRSLESNLLVSSASPDWANVYGQIGNKSLKYGYNIHEDRWSYANEPEEAAQLASKIRKLSSC